MFTMEATLTSGLTARRAVSFIQQANSFQSQIRVIKDHGFVTDAKSILGIMSLGLHQGQKVTFEAQGKDEREAVNALIKFVSGGHAERKQQKKRTRKAEDDHRTLIG